jgi:guanyl-specific ribonuclease Sa
VSNRSTRRIITGGAPVTDPPEYFYTDDHYDSFCLITDAGARS